MNRTKIVIFPACILQVKHLVRKSENYRKKFFIATRNKSLSDILITCKQDQDSFRTQKAMKIAKFVLNYL